MRLRNRIQAVLVTAGALLCLATVPTAGAAEATAPSARLSAVRAETGTLSVLVSAQGLPDGTEPEPGSVQVQANGATLTATAGTPSRSTGASPVRAVFLLLDTSGSMAGAPLAAAKAAAASYVRGLPADVRVGLIAFSARPKLLLQPTADDSAFIAALGALRATGGTSLYDAVTVALHSFAAQGLGTSADRRLLVLSDGDDTASRDTLNAVSGRLRAADVPADVVALTAGQPSAALRRIAAAAGGQVIATGSSTGLTRAFTTSARAVSGQLLVTARIPARFAGTAAMLTVRLRAGSQVLTATAPVVFAAVVRATQSTAPQTMPVVAAPLPAHGAVWRWATLGVLFAAFFLLAVALLSPARARTRRLRQIETYTVGSGGPAPAGEAPEQAAAGLAGAALSLADRAVKSRGREERIAADLDRAELSVNPSEWMLLRVCVGAALVSVLFVLTGNLLLGLLVGGLIAWLGGRLFVDFRISRRCSTFGERLPDALQLVASSLRSGFSLAQALDALVRQGLPPLSTEFGRALAEARIGVPVEDALDKVADRMESQDLHWTVMAIRIQREVGGNLSEVLLETAETMRERARVRRQVRALSAEGRLSGYILIALPILVSLFMLVVRGDYLRPLYTQPIGILMSLASVALTTVGWFWMSKLAKVEV